MQFTPLPNLFFSRLLPQINDMGELKTTLCVLAALYHKRGYHRFVTYGELLANKSLMSSLGQTEEAADEVLRNALEMATKRGTIIHIVLDRNGEGEDIYFLNTESDRQTIAKIQSGELRLPGLKVAQQAYIEQEQPDIFSLYEQNIGMLTPMIAEELREAEKLYPESWIRDAIKEAVNQNKRKWGYISAILERWSTEGRGDGTYRRDLKKADPDKYVKGKYGHMVRR
jgi:DnaD/phage-associated family protein